MSVTSVKPFGSLLKYLDQPNLIHKLGRVMPIALPAMGVTSVVMSTVKAPPEKRKETFIKYFSVMAGAITFALFATRRYAKLDPHDGLAAAKAVYKGLADAGKPVSEGLKKLLDKSGTKILTPGDVHALRKELANVGDEKGALLAHVIPDPVNVGAKAILKDIKNLSLLGLWPVVGGIVGGVAGNALNGDDWRGKLSNQTKEGFYQYASNIFLCNVGAALFLLMLEKTPWAHKKAFRLGGMSLGIALMGVLGGSSIANFFGKHFINPISDGGLGNWSKHLKTTVRENGFGGLFKNLNDERRPELVDVGLHVDDFATVGVLAGLKWILPALAALYTFSGYRAGIGYRNGHGHGGKPEEIKPSAEQPAMAGNPFGPSAPAPALFNNGTVFRSFYDQRQQLRASTLQ